MTTLSTITTEPVHTLERTVCYNHPAQETGLYCTQCNRPICTKCMVVGVVGQICRACALTR